MEQHKYESLVKFVKLDGVKEFKETDPSLFSDDGISTSTLEVDNGQDAPVTMLDAKRACEMFLSGDLSIFQFQQWGEWIHMMDFFDLIPNGESPDNDESLIEIISEIDNIDLVDEDKRAVKIKGLINSIDEWLKAHK